MNMKAARKEFLNWIVYQIYPRSFYDSNGDGIGDLSGITEKLDHLTELGVNAVWICPCYKSPNQDNGYDISDYRDIMDEFGTLDDWKRLRDGLKSRGIKLIMDLVANHTSDRHFWFQEAKKSKDNPYRDYYYWAETPPNDWVSVFGGSAWKYDETTGEYYLHSFAEGQPDLNWTNPKVRKEMQAVVDFWVSQGVDGFRCDVLDYISKDFTAGKMFGGPQLHEYVRELFGRDEVKHIFTVGECSFGEDGIVDICGQDRDELTCVFQFRHFGVGRIGRFQKAPYAIDSIKDVLVKWQNFTEKHQLLYTLFTDNHDQPPYISRLGNDREFRYECATMYATTFYLLKGIPFIYQGQEYGVSSSKYDRTDVFDDVETVNYYRANQGKISDAELLERLNFGSRDNARHPIAWTKDAPNYGFSVDENVRPWLLPASRAAEINLEKDKESEKSIFRFYQKLIALRKDSEAVRYGEFTDKTPRENCFVYERAYESEKLTVVCNFEREQKICAQAEGELVLSNYGGRENVGGTYRPFEIAVWRKK